MRPVLTRHPTGDYSFLPGDGSRPFCRAVVAEGARVRPGETSPAALREKTADVVRELSARLDAIGQGWHAATHVAVYTTHDALAAVRAELVPLLGPAALDAVRWFFSRPPIVGL